MVFRLNISEEEKQKIISELMKFINKDYDYIRVLKLSSTIILYKVLQFEPKYKLDNFDQIKNTICTDLIIFSMMDNSPVFKAFIEKIFSKLDVSKYGSFSADDFKVIFKFFDCSYKNIDHKLISR